MKLMTRIRSRFMRAMSSEAAELRLKQRGRSKRLSDQAPVIHYFHSITDPFSLLTIQCLQTLIDRYDINLRWHFVSRAGGDYVGDTARLDAWALRDAEDVASHYGLAFPQATREGTLEANLREMVEVTSLDGFVEAALEVGGQVATHGLPDDQPTDPTDQERVMQLCSDFEHSSLVREGDRLRNKLGHYASALFYFEGQWYWGVDRLRVLESRLQEEHLARTANTVAYPEPSAGDLPDLSQSDVCLEYFPSLRSPYTAVGHDRVLRLIEATKVKTEVRVVMPMMMRGVPAPRQKGQLILSDAAREGRFFGSPMGRIVDPFGEPVRKACAYLPQLRAEGLLMPFVTQYLSAAWVEGLDITSQKGLSAVLHRAGASEDIAPSPESDWRREVEGNLAVMQNHDLWGVPSFRISGGGHAPFACWGQDRIWRVARELKTRAKS